MPVTQAVFYGFGQAPRAVHQRFDTVNTKDVAPHTEIWTAALA